MNTAAKVREAKEKNPENFCPNPRCLWRTETRYGTKPCPKHQSADVFDTLEHAVRHIRRTHMNTRAWTLTTADEEAIKILEDLKNNHTKDEDCVDCVDTEKEIRNQ
jgi:hypothetical protein